MPPKETTLSSGQTLRRPAAAHLPHRHHHHPRHHDIAVALRPAIGDASSMAHLRSLVWEWAQAHDMTDHDIIEYVSRLVAMGWLHLSPPPKPPPIAATGTRTKLTAADFTAAAEALKPGVDVAMIQAFAEVESGGHSGFGPRGLPKIAYEGHIFRKYTKHKYDTTYPLLSYPYKQKAGPEWRVNNKDQDAAWATLNAAMELDHAAALKACSWGMFQVMGFNFAACGYADIDAFVAAMKAGEKGQLEAFVGFCKKTSGLRQALADKNFVQCATLYNGSDYGDYDQRIKNAYRKHGGR